MKLPRLGAQLCSLSLSFPNYKMGLSGPDSRGNRKELGRDMASGQTVGWELREVRSTPAKEHESYHSHTPRPQDRGLAFVSFITKSLEGGVTSRMAEDISLEKGAISSQHTQLADGCPTKVELWAQGWLGEYLKSTQPSTHGRTLSASQMAAPPTTQPWPWRPWGASSMCWHSTPQQAESCGKPQ